MAKNKKRRNSGTSRKSTLKKVGLSVAAVGAGAVAGAVLNKLSLAAGIGAIVLGTMQNNSLLTLAGAAAAISPSLSSDEKSTAGGVTALLANAKTSIHKLAANTYDKTYIPQVFPNLLPSLTLGDVDADYYGSVGQSAQEMAFNRAMSGIGTGDDYMGGFEDEGVGRLGVDYQAQELATGESIGSFAEVAAQASRNW